jgi:MoaA/NifB/PqqE/SkfB family radical SAM enzyme
MSKLTHRLSHQGWDKPSRNEREYFHREEFRHRMDAARDRETERADDERNRWLEEHGGHCPRCAGRLEALRTPEGTVEQCPNCLGVWMDHELFDHLTHPERERDDYLTGIFREVILQYTTGAVTTGSRHG